MTCLNCTATLPDEDLFCEECGVPVQAAAGLAAACVCGATDAEIDEDGYCERCGKRARRPASDHIEVIVGPDFAGVSDRGVKHARNEDRFAIQRSEGGAVLVVCDGVSSSQEPEVASSAAAEFVAEALAGGGEMAAAIEGAQARLVAMQGAEAHGDPPSTTLVAALVSGDRVTLGWVGDSRAYWIPAEGEPRQVTTDHSWMNEVVSSGTMTVEQAERSPKAHAITRWLGADAGDNARPEIAALPLQGSGTLVVCTDGLWNYAPLPEDIARLLRDAGDGEAIEAARKLVEFAIAQGGHDNITVVLLRVGG